MAADLSRLYETFVPGYREGFPMSSGLPLLTPELLDELRVEIRSDPVGALERAHRAIDSAITYEDLLRFVDHLGEVFANPDLAIASKQAKGSAPVPDSFGFAGMETDSFYQPDVNDAEFEDGDWTGYGINVGTALLKRFFTGQAPFRWHDAYASRFHYKLRDNASVALFSDFGTGKPHSYYISKFITQAQPDAAIHLGDVYYAGRPAEVQRYYDAPLARLVASHELWSIPGNHDYYASGQPFFDGLDGRRAAGVLHRQEGSYFVLDSSSFRIIGIDGEYHSGTRYKEPKLRTWLAEEVAAAKKGGKQVILLSSDEPYGHGASAPEALLDDVTSELNPTDIDLWFWGNTHYCAFYRPSDKLRAKFYGSCIGHGGYPYKRLETSHSPNEVATHLWAETEPRFPLWTGARQDMGNNGFAIMKLDDQRQSLILSYYDWTNALRLSVAMSSKNKKLEVSALTPYPRPECRSQSGMHTLRELKAESEPGSQEVAAREGAR